MKLSTTETSNPRTENIDIVSTLEALKLINNEDKTVAECVETTLSSISQAIDVIVDRLCHSGSVFYIGTGTSGRLGVLDASEIPPTFGVSPELIQGIIAGGYDAMHKAVEASEDDREAGKKDLVTHRLTRNDVVIGIAASGKTQYTIGAVEYAKSIGCFTACVTCSGGSPITEIVDIPIVAEVGPEVITGSTRMKSGTAQKMILNMISTVTMVRLGYVKGNKMINLKPGNKKLVDRSLRILMSETGLDLNEARNLFESAKNDVRIALVMYETDVSATEAGDALETTGFVVIKAIEKIHTTK